MIKIYSEITFEPLFRPNTSIYFSKINIADNTEIPLSGGLLSGLLGSSIDINQPIPFEKLRKCRLNWYSPENCAETTNTFDIQNFLKDTYVLIDYYGNRNHIDKINKTVNYSLFAQYCNKYGYPFSEKEYGNTPLEFFEFTFSTINDYLIWKKPNDLKNICLDIASAVEQYHKETGHAGQFLISFTTKSYEYQNSEHHEYYPMSSPYGNYKIEICDLDIRSHLPSFEYMGVPSFSLAVLLSDLQILRYGTEKERQKWFVEKALANLSLILKKNPPVISFFLKDDTPIIKCQVKNSIISFLLVLFTTPKAFNICPECGELLTNGKLYCPDKPCKQKHYAKTDHGKLLNLLNKWRTQGHFDKRPDAYHFFKTRGTKRLNRGDTYETVLEELQKFKKIEFQYQTIKSTKDGE